MSSASLETAASLRRSLANLDRRLRPESRVLGLSAAKHSVLGLLYRDGPRTAKELAHSEGVQPQSVTRVLADLEEAGLILRKQDESDRRQFQLEITAEGRDLLFEDSRNRVHWLATAIEERLTVFERELLRLSIQLLDKIAEVPLQDRADAAPVGSSTECTDTDKEC
jgi:DNA-binding MarR family transcriptional regulator